MRPILSRDVKEHYFIAPSGFVVLSLVQRVCLMMSLQVEAMGTSPDLCCYRAM